MQTEKLHIEEMQDWKEEFNKEIFLLNKTQTEIKQEMKIPKVLKCSEINLTNIL